MSCDIISTANQLHCEDYRFLLIRVSDKVGRMQMDEGKRISRER